MTADVQAPPFAVQVEPTEGCNLRCGFCGIRGIRDQGTPGQLSGPFRFMALETAATLAHKIAAAGWNPRLEFAMHGEPTLHPKLGELIWLMRRRLPDAYVLLTTNGVPLLDGDLELAVTSLFAYGVDTVAVDDYKPHAVAPALRDLAGRWRDHGISLVEYPADKWGNPHRRSKARRLVIVEDIAAAEAGTHSHLSNHAGCAAPADDSYRGERCAVPFRELSVRWDGSVALCCNDWRGVFKVGNVMDDPLEALWNGLAMQAARRILYWQGREFAPCRGCTHRTYRNGLLPDKLGKATMQHPVEEDYWQVENAAGGRTLTPVVLRRWERDGSGAALVEPGLPGAAAPVRGG